jgi:short-subunit dehydrogenase involved in D-alanine esterification of teichoic acids
MFQSDLLKDRTIFITGGGTGLGKSMSMRFAELGANIFLMGRRPEPLAQTVKEIEALGGDRRRIVVARGWGV